MVPISTPALYTAPEEIVSRALPQTTARVFNRPLGAFMLKIAFPGTYNCLNRVFQTLDF